MRWTDAERLRLLEGAEAIEVDVQAQGGTRCVGAGLDWVTIAFSVELSEAVLRELGVRGEHATAHRCADVTIEGWSATLRPPAGGRWFLQNDGERVTVWPRAPGGDVVTAGDAGEVAEGLGAATTSTVHVPGWNLVIEMSGVALLEWGWKFALERTWGIARRFGRILAARVRRIDLRADFVAFPIVADDTGRLVRRSRARPAVYAGALVPEGLDAPTWTEEADERGYVLYTHGRHASGIVIGQGGDIVCRVYDKTLEIGLDQDGAADRSQADLATRAKANAKRDAWREHWTAKGWALSDRVTRVEFQITGDALVELARPARAGNVTALPELPVQNARCEVRGPIELPEPASRVPRRIRERDASGRRLNECGTMSAYAREPRKVWWGCGAQLRALAELLDPLWGYLTRRWLRLIVPSMSRLTNCPTDTRWEAVQGVTFEEAGAPGASRKRTRGTPKATMAQGACLNVAAAAGKLPDLELPKVDEQGQTIEHPEKRWAAQLDDPAGTVRRLLAFMAPIAAEVMAEDLLASGRDPREVAEHLATKWGSARARFRVNENAPDLLPPTQEPVRDTG